MQREVSVSHANNLLEVENQAEDRIEDHVKNQVEAAAKRRKNAAHGASRGSDVKKAQAPEWRKKINDGERLHLNNESVHPTHAQLLTGLDINAELIRSRHDRKPSRSIAFATKTAWAG